MLKDKGLDMILVFDGRPLPPKLSVMKERYLKRCEARVIAEMNVENVLFKRIIKILCVIFITMLYDDFLNFDFTRFYAVWNLIFT